MCRSRGDAFLRVGVYFSKRWAEQFLWTRPSPRHGRRGTANMNRADVYRQPQMLFRWFQFILGLAFRVGNNRHNERGARTIVDVCDTLLRWDRGARGPLIFFRRDRGARPRRPVCRLRGLARGVGRGGRIRRPGIGRYGSRATASLGVFVGLATLSSGQPGFASSSFASSRGFSRRSNCARSESDGDTDTAVYLAEKR